MTVAADAAPGAHDAALRRIARLEGWLLGAAAMVLPLVYWPLTYDQYVLPKLVVARSFVLALALLFAARAVITGAVFVKRSALDLPLIALVGSAILSTTIGVNLGVGIFGTYARYDGVLTLVTYAALFWLAMQAIANGSDARALIRALVAGGFAVSVLSIVLWLVAAFGEHTARALGTMGNPDILGAYLGMLCPVAFGELIGARSVRSRVLAGNALIAILLALLLSLSRSAWLGLAFGAAVLLAMRQITQSRTRILAFVSALFLLGIAAVALLPLRFNANPSGWLLLVKSFPERVHIWQDTLALIASRPIFGYGPDTFGLVFPGFQTGQWTPYLQIDKAHAELLQIAATQGLIGVIAYLWLIAAFIRTFWRGRHQDGAWPLFAGLVAYELTLQLNFTALAAAFPFWIFAAAAVALWDPSPRARVAMLHAPRVTRAIGAGVALTMAALIVPALVLPYLADSSLRDAVNLDAAGHAAAAADAAGHAKSLAPHESVYAVEVGNIAFERGNWAAASDAYVAAARVGSFSPEMFRHLAIAERALGRSAEALAAARHAVYLDRFDPANQALLSQMEAPSP